MHGCCTRIKENRWNSMTMFFDIATNREMQDVCMLIDVSDAINNYTKIDSPTW